MPWVQFTSSVDTDHPRAVWFRSEQVRMVLELRHGSHVRADEQGALVKESHD